MKKLIFTIVWMIVYFTAGTYCQRNELISHPAYWACFESFFGVALAYALVYGKK